jgi:hypothetical protein
VTRTADSDYWMLELSEWLFDEIIYRSHMRTRNRLALALLPPVAVGAIAGFGSLSFVAVTAYLWVVWTWLYEREVGRFLPSRLACYLMVCLYVGQAVPAID